MRIGERVIGHDQPVFLVAEVGVTSNGDLQTALKLADAVKASGADAIKYMLNSCDALMADKTVDYTYRWAGGTVTENMHAMLKATEFTWDEWVRITDHCRDIGLAWYLTVDYPEGVAWGEMLMCPGYKLSSWDIRNVPLIRAMAETKKPIQIDLGPASEEEIEDCLSWIGHGNVMLVYTTHAENEAEYNLRSIPYLRERFGLSVGWSASDVDEFHDHLAISAGACLVEKRISLNPDYKGHHHIQSLSPIRFREWVSKMRWMDRVMGRECLSPSSTDLRMRDKYLTSLHYAGDYQEGTVLSRAMLASKRPGAGVSPKLLEQYVGKSLVRNVKQDTYVRWDDV